MATIDQVFSIVALFILFRETVEASIVCGVLTQFLARSKPKLKRAVWWGVFGGVATSIVFGVIFVVVFYVAKNNLFKGKNKDLFKGIISWIAGILITYLGFAMFRFMGWEDKWRRRLEEAAAKRLAEVREAEAEQKQLAVVSADAASDSTHSATLSDSTTAAKSLEPKDSAMTVGLPPVKDLAKLSTSTDPLADPVKPAVAVAPGVVVQEGELSKEQLDQALKVMEDGGVPLDMSEPTRKEWSNIFFLVWTTVTREGIESVVFLGGVGAQVKLTAIPLAALVGITAGVLVGVFLFYTGKTVRDLKWFLIIMGVVVLFIAAGQISIGTDAMIRAGMFGYCSIWMDERPWYMQPLYDISECCGDQDAQNKFFSLARAIFGYQDKPTIIEVAFYLGYWVIVLIIMFIKWRTGSLFDADYKYKRQQAKLRKEQEAAEAARRAAEVDALGLPAPPAVVVAADAEGVPVQALAPVPVMSVAVVEGAPAVLPAAEPSALVGSQSVLLHVAPQAAEEAAPAKDQQQ